MSGNESKSSCYCRRSESPDQEQFYRNPIVILHRASYSKPVPKEKAEEFLEGLGL